MKRLKRFIKQFFQGAVCGIVFTLCVLSVLRFFGIRILPAGNAATQAYTKNKYIEQCIDSYYQGDYTDEDLANGAGQRYGRGAGR